MPNGVWEIMMDDVFDFGYFFVSLHLNLGVLYAVRFGNFCVCILIINKL